MDLGQFRIETAEDVKPMDDTLLSGQFKKFNYIALKVGQSDKPIASLKNVMCVRKVSCDFLDLMDQEMLDHIDCSQLSLSTGERHAHRFSFRQKQKRLTDEKTRALDMYPLKDSYVHDEISRILEWGNISHLNYIDPDHYGFYFELDSKNDFRCNFNLVLSQNNSDQWHEDQWTSNVFTRLARYYHKDFMLYTSGNCVHASDPVGFFKLNFEFLIIKQQEFPYLTVKHDMKIVPLKQLFEYKATVSQRRSNKPDSYDTKVEIESSSALINFLNFRLSQTISNEDLQNGMETMHFVNPKYAIEVVSTWSPEIFSKQVKLNQMFLNNVTYSRQSDSKILHEHRKEEYSSVNFLDLRYLNNASSSDVKVYLVIPKNVLSILSSVQPKNSEGDLQHSTAREEL